MLKMYLRRDRGGASVEYWDERWHEHPETLTLRNARRMCESSPLWPMMESKLVTDRLFMDGGCGPAQWVKYYHDRGYRTLGIDYAPRTVERIRSVAPDLNVRHGDVRALPLADGEVHVYYSGGVVEHFEEGPDEVLREARRVVARDGWFLCSVPDLSPFRDRWLFRNAGHERDLVTSERFGVRRADHTVLEPAPDAWAFHQYAFKEAEFRQRLERAGFQVEESFGYSVVWALFEVPGLERAHNAALGLFRSIRGVTRARASGRPESPEVRMSNGVSSPAASRNLISRLIVSEDTSIPVLGQAVRLATELVPHMRMYIARPA